MRLLARLLIAVVCVAAAAVLMLGVAGGVGVWAVQGPLTDKAARAFDKAEAALAKAERGLALVRASVTNAAERLEAVRREQRAVPPGNTLSRRLLARTVQQTIGPLLGDAHLKLGEFAEAAVAAKGVLEIMADAPILADIGVDTDPLLQLKGQLAGAAPAAWELSRLLGDGGTADEIDAQCTRVELALRSARELVAGYETQVADLSRRVAEVRTTTFRWILPATALISAVCFWTALSQLSVLAHARSWWRWLGRPPA